MEESDDVVLTVSVPEFGKLAYGISINSAYQAADRGEIPTITIGGKRRVPVRIALLSLVAAEDIEKVISRWKAEGKIEHRSA